MLFVFDDFNEKRSLFTEMICAQRNLSYSDFDLLLNVIYALNLANDNFFPIFENV